MIIDPIGDLLTRLRNAYLAKFNISGDLLEFPYNNEDEMFNVDQIIDSIKRN